MGKGVKRTIQEYSCHKYLWKHTKPQNWGQESAVREPGERGQGVSFGEI
jgi:hypothetical protein